MKRIKLQNLLELILIGVILLILITAKNKLMHIYKILLVIFAAIPFFIIKSDNKHKLNIKINKENIIWIVLLIFFAISLFYTIDMKSTIYFLVIYLCIFSFLFHKLDKTFWEKVLKLIEITTIICAITILFEKCLPDLFANIFGGFAYQESDIYEARTKGYFSGILFEGARAAFVMNVGIAVVYSNLLTEKGKRYTNIIKLIILFIALLLTGKRTLTAIGIILIIIIYLISNRKKNAYKKMLITGSIVILSIVLLSCFMPDILTPFKRMVNINSTFGGRIIFWTTALDMFKNTPIIGQGIGSFNKYLANQGFTYYGKAWTSYAHNSYLQILGETGILGIALMLVAMTYPLIKNILMIIKNKDNDLKQKLLVCLYIQLLFIIYALTGNPFHNFYEISIYLIFMNFIIQTNLKKEMCDKKDE